MDDDPWGEEPSWARGDGGDEDDDEGEDEGPTIGASHVLVMIDCNPSMFVPSIRLTSDDDDDGNRDDVEAEDNSDQQGGDDEGAAMVIDDENATRTSRQQQLVTPFEAALRATEKLIRGKVNSVATSRGGTRDGVGVMLFATKKFNPDEKLRDGADGEKMNGDGTAFKKSGDYNENGRPNASGDDSDSDSDEDGDGIGGDAYLTSFFITSSHWHRLERSRLSRSVAVSPASAGAAAVCSRSIDGIWWRSLPISKKGMERARKMMASIRFVPSEAPFMKHRRRFWRQGE